MCAVDGEVLLVQPHNASRTPVLSFQARDVEVIGRISAVIRSIGNGNGNGAADAIRHTEAGRAAEAARAVEARAAGVRLAEARAAEARPVAQA
jgi:hypothetical protein